MSEDNENKKSVINVVGEFDYSTQNDAYNDKFKKWRQKKDNPYAFSFEANTNEKVYVDGKGFIDRSAEDAEKEVLTRIFYVIGIGALMCIVFENFLGKLGIAASELLGFNIHNNFFSSSIYGDRIEIVTAVILISTLKIAVPLLFIRSRFRLPARVEFMGGMKNSLALLGAISITLIICTAASLPNAYSSESKEIYDYFRSIDADVSVWDQSEFLIYTVFDVIIMSLLTEMLFRGAMFGVLRQFGDLFAIMITSVTAAILTQDLRAMPVVFLISLTASYGMLTSGAIFTAVAVSIVYKMYNLAILVLETDPTEKMPLTRNIFMIITLIAGIIGFVIFWLGSVRRKKVRLAHYSSELPLWRRSVHSVKTFPYSAVLLICVVYGVIRTVL